jgi:type II secretory pathway pseudopilin PulG
VNEEPDPDQLIQEPKPYYSVTYWLVYTVVIFVVIALLGALGTPHLIRSKKKSYQSEAISNSKLLSLALFEFDSDYGSYPNEETAKDVTEAFPNHGYDFSGNSSNAIFRQLIAAGIVKNEDVFYFNTKGAKKPDGNISPGHALEKGECNYAYISGQSSAGNPSQPILLCPVIPGTKKLGSNDSNGTIIVIKADNSVGTYKLDSGGPDILSPKHLIWKGKAPDIRYPE